jgi:hypothetical protein
MSYLRLLWVIGDTCELSETPICYLRHLWVVRDTYELSETPMSYLRHLWVIWDTYELSETTVSCLRHLWVIWDTCELSETTMSYLRHLLVLQRRWSPMSLCPAQVLCSAAPQEVWCNLLNSNYHLCNELHTRHHDLTFNSCVQNQLRPVFIHSARYTVSAVMSYLSHDSC